MHVCAVSLSCVAIWIAVAVRDSSDTDQVSRGTSTFLKDDLEALKTVITSTKLVDTDYRHSISNHPPDRDPSRKNSLNRDFAHGVAAKQKESDPFSRMSKLTTEQQNGTREIGGQTSLIETIATASDNLSNLKQNSNSSHWKSSENVSESIELLFKSKPAPDELNPQYLRDELGDGDELPIVSRENPAFLNSHLKLGQLDPLATYGLARIAETVNQQCPPDRYVGLISLGNSAEWLVRYLSRFHRRIIRFLPISDLMEVTEQFGNQLDDYLQEYFVRCLGEQLEPGIWRVIDVESTGGTKKKAMEIFDLLEYDGVQFEWFDIGKVHYTDPDGNADADANQVNDAFKFSGFKDLGLRMFEKVSALNLQVRGTGLPGPLPEGQNRCGLFIRKVYERAVRGERRLDQDEYTRWHATMKAENERRAIAALAPRGASADSFDDDFSDGGLSTDSFQ